MRSKVSIPGTTITGMLHHVKDSLKDTFYDHIILHNSKNDLECSDLPERNCG